MLYEKKLLTHPFIYLSEFFEEHRQDYYDLLRGVSERSGWENWILFFLKGLDIQACKAQEAAKKILELHASLKDQVLLLGSKYANDFLDALFINPFFSSRTIKKEFI